MPASKSLKDGRFAGRAIAPGDVAQVDLKVSESVAHQPMRIPVTVARGRKDGPVLYVTSAIHGDEINGVAIVRRLLDSIDGLLEAGTLVAVPIVNRFGFESGERYLPDRRDLNRHFPGDPKGSMAARLADHVFRKIVQGSDFGVDLHTAAVGNTNLCHIRGDADRPEVKALMKSFGTPIMVHGDGPRGSLRRAATEAGVPTILYEAGEPGRFQRRVVDVGHAGLVSLLRHLRMAPGKPTKPPLQILVREAEWVRSDHGGILDLDVEPGDIVRKGDTLGTIHDPLGRHVDAVDAPISGVVLGTTTSPLVFPGLALVHLGQLEKTYDRARAYADAGGDLGHVHVPGGQL